MMYKMMTLLIFVISLSSVWALPVTKSGPIIASSNPEINPGLFEGDIVGFHPKKLQGSVIPESYKWPGGVIVYQIDAVLTDEEKAIFQAAVDGYAKKTCIKFKKRTCEKDYISVQKLNGCYSYIGRTGGKQILSLGDGCWRSVSEPGTVQHEFLHALGFVHEQSRPDRDQYVKIDYTNIIAGKEGNFEKYSVDEITTSDTPYDYGSVMHYGPYGFNKDSTKPTIIAPAGKKIGQRVSLSDTDALEINKRYNCAAFL